ncbi:Na/Pi symporter [Aminiphilus sp.]|uniref:Na/Pi cotransporter family protein n=1 Tax=Aminiphilus sp. TaxID=1872488 RepID=UPI00260AE59B|nr:Na/Pi symporter [Aminiphilus sp.]
MGDRVLWILEIVGGLALFLYGVEECTRSFRQGFGGRAKAYMAALSRRKPASFLFGVLLSAAAQSSSVATSFALGMTDAGLLSLGGAVVVMMGASAGATFVTLLLSLEIVTFAPLLLALSLIGSHLSGGGILEKWSGLLRSIALLLTGMFLLKLGVGPLTADPETLRLLAAAAGNPLTLGIVAMALTTLLQSSSAVMALALALAGSGVLETSAALPVVLGAHLGSTGTILLASLGGKTNARRLGAATFLYKLAGTGAAVAAAPFLGHLAEGGGTKAALVTTQMGVAWLNALLLFPFSERLEARTTRLFRGGVTRIGEPLYLNDDLVDFPQLALFLLKKEMTRLASALEGFSLLLFRDGPARKEVLQLREGVTALGETCLDYTFRVASPGNDAGLLADQARTSYAMIALKGLTDLLAQGFFLFWQGSFAPLRPMLSEDARWRKLEELLQDVLRLSLRAFVLGDTASSREAQGQKEALEKQAELLRRSLAGREQGTAGETTALLEYLFLAGRIAGSATQVARAEQNEERLPSRKNGENEPL